MTDLIDRQAAIDAVNDCGICIQRIVDIPSADAVEIVRCRDCKYSDFGECKHTLGLIVAEDENYCSYGVRQ